MWKQECQEATTNEYPCRRENIDLAFRGTNCRLRSMSECKVHRFFPLLRDLNPPSALTVVRRAESQIYLEAAKSKREREWPRVARSI